MPMWLLMVVPVAVVASVSLVAALRRPPALLGHDPEGLRTVVEWRDPESVAADIAGEPAEQLRQLVGALAEQRFILASSIDKGDRGRHGEQPFARIDVRERRYEMRARIWRGGRWLLWIDERHTAPQDCDDLRQLLTGLYRTLEERKAEAVAWHRRERLAQSDRPAPTPFYVD
jgi:hypothetical protein